MMKGGLGGLMKQAQQMQENVKKAREQLATLEVQGESGGGIVKVTMTCGHQVRRIELAAAAMDDREMLEDLLVAALNDATRQVETTTQQKMAGFSAGLNLPPGFKLPF